MTKPATKVLFSGREWRRIERELDLTARQKEIIRFLLNGMSDKDIARQADVAVPTVRTHLTRLFARLDVQDRNELVVFIFRRFLDLCSRAGTYRRSVRRADRRTA